MNDINNPIRVSIRDTSVNIDRLLRHPNFQDRQVTKIEIRPHNGNLLIHWEACNNE